MAPAPLPPGYAPVEVILIQIRYVTHLKPTLVGTQLVRKLSNLVPGHFPSTSG